MTDAYRHEFRAFVRTHHPDIGGDPEIFAAGLLRFRNSAAPGAGSLHGSPALMEPDDPRLQAPIVFRRTPHGLAAVRAWIRHKRNHNRPSRVR